jgi:hypothetical protein
MGRLTKTEAPTPEEQALYVQFCDLCDRLEEYVEQVSIGSKFGYGDKPVIWITYKSSRVNTKWIYVHTEDRLLHNMRDMYLWSVTPDSQEKIIQVMRDKLLEYQNSPQWNKIRENNLARKKYVKETLKTWRDERNR